MEHGYAGPALDGLKEYLGDPDEIVELRRRRRGLRDPSGAALGRHDGRLPALKLVAVSRGGPVNIDMEAARAARHQGRQHARPQRQRRGRIHASARILAETRMIRAGHEALRQGEWRGDLYRADTTGRELIEMTVGVIGYGAIGTRVVRLLRAFGCTVLVADPYVQLSAADRADGVEHVGLEASCSSAPTS